MVVAESERSLVEACQQGSREAFHALFLAHKDRVYSIALRFSGNEATAMDITQDTFLKLFFQIGSFRGEASFESWLYRLVVNSCLDQKRKTRRLVPLLEEMRHRLFVSQDNPAASLARSETSRKVQAAVAKLSPDLRLSIVLRYTEGLSYEEMAEVFGVSKGTVASRLNRAHKELARRLLHMNGRLEE
ncbi:MAG TPA: sigma-70 family RNA polymerase sigma factor [Bryobacteraceae bacterium]|jgi:RNA polymerase sigma-70 factor (ECF subfamily)|nr:sigma-70 family RNA polymerase sigma factor [Bryobacteraceae bacterium]